MHSDPETIRRWTVGVSPLTREMRRAWEAITTVSDGWFGSRGLCEAGGSRSWPSTVAGGAFRTDDVPDLLHGAIWTSFRVDPEAGWVEDVQLDLGDGIVQITLRRPDDGQSVVVRRFALAAAVGVGVQVATGPSSRLVSVEPLERPAELEAVAVESAVRDDVQSILVSDRPTGCSIAVAAHDDVTELDACTTLRRFVGLAAGEADIVGEQAHERASAALSIGVDRLISRQREIWNDRWARCGTDIDGDVELDRSVRFATFQLLAAAPDDEDPGTSGWPGTPGIGSAANTGIDRPDEIAIGARGLTGSSYRGHVFWDTDVFVVPALSALAPSAARRALNYRWNRLSSAMARARAEGRSGARFPWESATTGEEVTPTIGRDLHGNDVAIRTGELEVHIIADIAWSTSNHLLWTGDDRFLRTRGIDLLVETARYWASRIECDDDGLGHIRHVIGPDEYHEDVDDNTFTNVMARHNLLIAADAARRVGVGDDAERRRWRDLADSLVDGYDPVTKLYEQFAGYHALDPMLVSSIGRPPLSADVLLGREVIGRVQVVKQPDVLMAFHLVPELMHRESFHANLDHYLPRTAHGSSLSPAICASLLARAGRPDDALELLEIAADLDLADLTRTTAGGLHLATIGGVWQAVTTGFLGIRPRDGALEIDPHVPDRWGRVAHRFSYCGSRIRVGVDGDEAQVDSSGDLRLAVGQETRSGRCHRLIRRNRTWEFR